VHTEAELWVLKNAGWRAVWGGGGGGGGGGRFFHHLGGFFTRTCFYGAGTNYGSGSFPRQRIVRAPSWKECGRPRRYEDNRMWDLHTFRIPTNSVVRVLKFSRQCS